MGASKFRIEGMCCSTEEGLIRQRLEFLPGIDRLEFDLIQRTLTVHHTLSELRPVVAALRSLRLDPVPVDLSAPRPVTPVEKAPSWALLIVAGAMALGAEVCELFALFDPWSAALLALVAVGLSGWTVYLKGWIAVTNLNLNINALMSIAVTGAILLQLWPEAAMVMVLFALAERIEGLSLERARQAIGGLLKLAPELATVVRPDGSWQTVASDSVPVGATVRVRPGERISHDGRVRAGTSSVDQSSITGESVPVDKADGDELFAGTVNLHGELVFEVTALAGNSTLSRIIHLVEEAQANRAPTQRFIDQFARVYTPVVFLLAVTIALIPPLLGLGSWFDWIYRALVLMVIACPCALVISTPVTVVSGLSAAARSGILIKGGTFLEQGRNLKVLAFDKTGTVTHGKPECTDFELLAGDPAEVKAWAISLAGRSDHPVSQAVARYGAGAIAVSDVSDFRAVAGRGVQGSIEGHTLFWGNFRWMQDRGLRSVELELRLAAWEAQGKTTVVLADTTKVLALFAVADTVKATSQAAIRQLHRQGVKTMMLSGDNDRTVQAIARSVGIDDAWGGQLPEDKLRVLEEASVGGRKVGMVGDGINDAPALTRAAIGFAMGGTGTGVAIESADVVLMDDDLRKVPQFIELSRKTSAILAQNITFALVTKVAFLALTLVGLGTMWMAVFADMGTSILVVLNGLRLLTLRLGKA